MKKLKFSLISVLIISLFFPAVIGCGSKTGSGSMTNSESVATDAGDLSVKIGGTDSDINNITTSLPLTTLGENGSTITWSSSNIAVIANDGMVVRPAFIGGNAVITLTATITKGGVTETKTFTVTVLKTPPNDTEAVTADKASLVDATILGLTNVDLNHITGNLTLPATGSSGTAIAWSSDNTAIITNAGVVNRPAYGAGDSSAITLTASITKGSEAPQTVTFSLIVIKTPQTDAEAIAADKVSLVNNSIRNLNADLSHVSTNLVLPATGSSGTAITWSSNNTGVIAHNGTVSSRIPDTTVIITATISKGTSTDTKPFSIIVLGTGTPNLTYTGIGDPVSKYSVAKGTANTTGSVIIPSVHSGLPVTTIDTNAFKDCTTMTGITIPQSVTAIGANAFESCTSLTSVTIPGSVTTMGNSVFLNCSNLTKVTVLALNPPSGGFDDDYFAGCSNLTAIVVSANRVMFYEMDFNWSRYESIIVPQTTQFSVDTEKNKITVAALGTLAIDEDVSFKAQALVLAGFTVSLVSSSDHSVITTDGSIIGTAGTSCDVVFRVSKDEFTSDTAALTLPIIHAWAVVGTSGLRTKSSNITMAFNPSGIPYVAYQDTPNSKKVTVRKLNGKIWETVGSAGFSDGEAYYVDLAIDQSGTPYVTYTDYGVIGGGKATVMKFNGSSWVTVGVAGFSAGFGATETTIALDSSGMPYVAYVDPYNSQIATVMKFNGTTWEIVGTEAFSAGTAQCPSIVIDSSNTPYVAYRDYANGGKATVMKFNGSSWVAVGAAAFSSVIGSISISLDPSGIPYVAFDDTDNNWKAKVMKFNGSSWETVGNAGFSSGNANGPSIAFSSGTPYVSYTVTETGGAEDYKMTVKKFNGTVWETVGAAGFTGYWASPSSLAIYDGIPYVVFSEGDTALLTTVMKFK